MATNLSIDDWLDMMEDLKDKLREQDWAFEAGGLLRNAAGQCPICALNTLAGGTFYYEAAGLAARELEPLDSLYAINFIMLASDRAGPPVENARKRLIAILEPKGASK